jgi:hypothetical protein
VRKSNRYPTVCTDEHLSPQVAAAFCLVLDTIEASKDRKFKGRDERDYVRELYRQNVVFATSDIEFVEFAYNNQITHAGLVYIPNRFTEFQKEHFAELSAIFICGGCRSFRHAFRGCILHPRYDGVHLVRPRRKSELVLSWAELGYY